MKVIDLTTRIAAREVEREIQAQIWTKRRLELEAQYLQEGRDLAELAHPTIEPLRLCEPILAQHLKGAFLRYQMERVRVDLREDPERDVTVGLALAVTVTAFTDRMIELEHGFDPNDGGFAA